MIKHALAATLTSLCLLTGVGAQSSSSTKAEAKVPPSMVRGWIFPGPDAEEAKIRFRLGKEGEAQTLSEAMADASQIVQRYQPVKAGAYQFALATGGKPTVKSQTLRPQRFYTVMAWEKEGKWTLQVMRDAPAAPNAATRPLRLLNFSGDRKALIRVGQGKQEPMAADSVREVQLPLELTGLDVEVLDPSGGPSARTSTEVDLRTMASAYLLVAPDYRGRMRPRLIEGGEVILAEEAPTQEGVSPAPAKPVVQKRKSRAAGLREEIDYKKGLLKMIQARTSGGQPSSQAQEMMDDLKSAIKALEIEAKKPSPPLTPRSAPKTTIPQGS